MKPLPPPRRRTPVKQDAIVSDLRRRIVAGAWKAGRRLPIREELAGRFQVSSRTLQRAMDRLLAEGFLRANGPAGTFVADQPPHLSRYAMVFPCHPGDPQHWNAFYDALSKEAAVMQRAIPHRLSLYYGVEMPEHQREWRDLVGKVRTHCFAGIIFTSPPFMHLETPLVKEPGMARVAIMQDAAYPGIPAVCTDSAGYMRKAVALLQETRRRRVALLMAATEDRATQERWRAAISGAGMLCPPQWVQAVNTTNPEWSRNLVHLLFSLPARQRPDALLITDDNLVPEATAGLLAAGMRVPEEVTVVAHANFPWPTASAVPARRLGYDARDILTTCVDLINRQRRGETPPPLTTFPAHVSAVPTAPVRVSRVA